MVCFTIDFCKTIPYNDVKIKYTKGAMKMETTIEFKVKQENTKWEDTPINRIQTIHNIDEINKYAARLSKVFKTEVRWNYEGLSQGHYINVN